MCPGVPRRAGALWNGIHAWFLLRPGQRSLCLAKGSRVGEDDIDIHAGRSYGVTSGRLIPQMSVITVSLVAGEMWGHLYL